MSTTESVPINVSPPLRSAANTALFVVLAALLPIVGDWSYKAFFNPRPFWVQYFDPETIYFYTGMQILHGHKPANVDNPGTPVMLVSAAVLPFTGGNPLAFDAFRIAGYIVSLLLNASAAYLLVRWLFAGFPPLLQIVGLWVFFLCSQSLEYDTVWSPELFYFPVGAVFITAFCRLLAETITWRGNLLVGGILGLCCALKFTFLAWVPAYGLALFLRQTERGTGERCKSVVVGGLGVTCGFVLSTLIIIDRYPQMFGWLWRLASRSGDYGIGAQGLPALADVMHNWIAAVLSVKGWFLWIFGCAVAVAAGWIYRRRCSLEVPRDVLPLVVWVGSSFTLSYLMASRNTALRYLLPTGFCGIVLYYLAVRMVPLRLNIFQQMCVLVVGAVLLGKHIATDVNAHCNRIMHAEKAQQAIQSLIHSHAVEGRTPVVIYGWRAPQPSFGLRIYADAESLRIIEQQYPFDGHYVNWLKRVFLPSGAPGWDFLVLRHEELSGFPELLGPELGRVGDHVVIGRPNHEE